MKRQATEWEKIFANHIYIRDLYLKYVRKLTTQKGNTVNGQMIWTDISPKKIYK